MFANNVSIASLARPFLAGAVLTPMLLAQSSPIDPGTGQEDFDVLDQVQGATVDFSIVPIRPVAHGRRIVSGSTTEPAVFVVNTHDSTLEVFGEDQTGSDPLDVFPLLWAPVSVVYWERDSEDPSKDELLITFNGTYGLLRMKTTGETVAYIPFKEDSGAETLYAEPSDILLDDREPLAPRAFVSCPGSDAVLQIDLAENEIERVYDEASYPDFRVKAPTFLAFDRLYRVLVAPRHSGNNSLAEPSPPCESGIDAGTRVLNLDEEVWDGRGDLPDEDLFRIVPDGNGGAGLVRPVAWATGTTLFGVGFNPLTRRVWQLNTDANNKDGDLQTEPHVRGNIVTNRIAIFDPKVNRTTFESSGGLAQTGLDSLSSPVGQPCSIVFRHTETDLGHAYVIGLLTDNLVHLDEDGTVVETWDLDDGSIPRGLVLSSDEEYAFVYCWGTNRLAKVHVAPPGSPDATVYFDLRHDPTPELVQAGRAHFYDGDNSGPGNISCASCHIDGRSDLLMWNLSAGDHDDKGPMLTQSLVGLEKLGPFHWRGERTLVEFNPAFDGLLGGDPLETEPDPMEPEVPTAFEEFEAFVFSLQNPANPNQHANRVIDNDIVARGVTSADSVEGQRAFIEDDIFRGKMTCNECHFLPTGTVGDTFPDSDALRPRRSWRKVAPFHELWRRDMSPLDVEEVNVQDTVDCNGNDAGDQEVYAYLGAAMSHSGLTPTLRGFVDAVNGTSTIEADNISSFLHQLDQGVAPAAHDAYWIHKGNYDGAEFAAVEDYLLENAKKGYCGIAVIGRVLLTTTSGPQIASVRWSYDHDDELFVPDHPDASPQDLDYFADQAELYQLDNLFVGMPVGMSDRWAIDYDMDDEINQSDTTPYEPPTTFTETDDPEFDVDPHIVWIAGNVARIAWATNEPTRYEITPMNDHYTHAPVSSDQFAKRRSVLVTGLRSTSPTNPTNPSPSSLDMAYEFHVRVWDRAGNDLPVPFQLGDLAMGDILTEPLLRDKGNDHGKESGQAVVVDCMEWDTFNTGLFGGVLQCDATVHVRYKFDVPNGMVLGDPSAPGRVVVASVVVVNEADPGLSRVLGHSDLTLGADTYLFDEVRTVTSTDVYLSLIGSSGGPFLVSHATESDGEAYFEFETSPVAVDEKLLLVIENVIAIDPDEIDDWEDDLPTTSTTLIEIPTSTPQPNRPSDMQRWVFPNSDKTELVFPDDMGDSCL